MDRCALFIDTGVPAPRRRPSYSLRSFESISACFEYVQVIPDLARRAQGVSAGGTATRAHLPERDEQAMAELASQAVVPKTATSGGRFPLLRFGASIETFRT